MYNNNVTSDKGDIGLTQIISDLTKKGYFISLPISEHLPYDLISDKGGVLKRIQTKYSERAIISYQQSYMIANGNVIINHYKKDDFELYGLYIPDKDVCVYVPNIIKSIKIRTTLPRTYALFYWWEDFLNPEIKELPKKRSIKEFLDRPLISRNSKRKVLNRPSPEELKKLLEETNYSAVGRIYGVSDNAVRKWAKSYNII